MRGLILCLSLGNDFTLFWLMKVNQKNWEGVSFSVDLFSWIKNASPSTLSFKPKATYFGILFSEPQYHQRDKDESRGFTVLEIKWRIQGHHPYRTKNTQGSFSCCRRVHRFLWLEITLNRKGPSRTYPNRPEESVNPWGRPVHLWYFLLPVWRSSQSKAMRSWLFLAVGQGHSTELPWSCWNPVMRM